MSYKNTKAAKTTIAYNLNAIASPVGNLFEAIAIIAKRAEQINVDIKTELTKKLEEFKNENEGLEEVFENKEQIEISKLYEKLPKPTAIAVEEWLNEEIYFRLDNKEDTQHS